MNPQNPQDSTERFSTRVENYQKYRPNYPEEVLDELMKYLPKKNDSIAADIGSGTGIFTKKLLDRGLKVYAVEPNDEMRKVAEESLHKYPKFHSIKGTAENTTLPDESVDLVTAAQAFHWFKPEPTLKEFQRILQPEGMVAFVWNERDLLADEFMKEYNQILFEYCPDYKKSPHLHINKEQILDYIEEITLEEFHYSNEQEFDKEGFIGRVLSSSYTPLPGSESYEPFIGALNSLFDKHQQNGKVHISYNTHLYLGRVLRKW